MERESKHPLRGLDWTFVGPLTGDSERQIRLWETQLRYAASRRSVLLEYTDTHYQRAKQLLEDTHDCQVFTLYTHESELKDKRARRMRLSSVRFPDIGNWAMFDDLTAKRLKHMRDSWLFSETEVVASWEVDAPTRGASSQKRGQRVSFRAKFVVILPKQV